MLIERLFSAGIMRMGPSRVDPQRLVGVFNPEFVSNLPRLRAEELEKFCWLAGEWSYENRVPATSASPAYSDIGTSRFSFQEKTGWICMVTPDGGETPHITFDPFSKQWVYVLIRGSYGILRSAQGWINGRISFSGPMIMIGINCEWRMTWTKEGNDSFSFVNEERNGDGSWTYIDSWHFKRNS